MMIGRLAAFGLTIALGPGHPAHAVEALFQTPPGCTLEVTVQNMGCTVEQIYRCAGDKTPGSYRQVFSRDGWISLAHMDAETRWLKNSFRDGTRDVLVDDSPDHASVSTLLATGTDEFDFYIELDSGDVIRYAGRDELTGETATIDGVKLERTRFSMTVWTPGKELLWSHSGTQYVSREMRMFFAGQEQIKAFDGKVIERSDRRPMRFDFPESKGFGSVVPQYDCDSPMVLHVDRKSRNARS